MYALHNIEWQWTLCITVRVSTVHDIAALAADGVLDLPLAGDGVKAGPGGDHINNWQHVQMYACFLVSGVIDLIGYYGLLPAGTEKAMLSLAFAGETILMGLHEKEEPLGCLFIIIAQIMFQPHVAWTLMPDDTAPLQVAKVWQGGPHRPSFGSVMGCPAKRTDHTKVEQAAEPTKGRATAQPTAPQPGQSTPQPVPKSPEPTKATQPAKPDKGKPSYTHTPCQPPNRWLDRDSSAPLNLQRTDEGRRRPLELCWWAGHKTLCCSGTEACKQLGKQLSGWVPTSSLVPVPEDLGSDIEDRDEALQPDLTEAQQNRKVSGEARAARDRDNTYHGRKCKIAHLIDHLPQELWDAFLADAVRPRVEAISERGVLASLLLGLLVRGLFTIRVADPLGLHDQPVYTDIPVSQAAIPDLSCRNLYLQLCRGPPGNGANTQPNAAVAAVLAEHPDLRARLAAIPRHLSDSNMVDHVGKQLETAFSNMLTLLFAGRLKKSVSLAGAKVLLGTEEHRRRFGFWGVGVEMVKQRVQSALSTAQLLASLEGDGDILVNIGKTGRNTAGERLVEWSRKQLSAACDSLKNQVHAAVCAVSDYPEPQTQEEQEALASQLARAIDVLRGAALLCVDCLTHCQSDPPPSLLSAAVMLHDNCLLVCPAIASGCMRCGCSSMQIGTQVTQLHFVNWHCMPLHSGSGGCATCPGCSCKAMLQLVGAGLPRKGPLVGANAALYPGKFGSTGGLVRYMQCSDTHQSWYVCGGLQDRASLSGRVTDIKTCYVMREGFTLLDYDNPSIHGIKRMLLEATMHPAFLHRQEGRRFLAFVFKLHAPMIQELTAIMKNQIPGLRRSVLQAYAEIIFRAWRDSVGCAHQYDIEAACVQDLMQCAISASTQPLAGALRTVLSGVHTQKKMAGVESMLCRLYEPILFRAFEAANADVRRNALLLMLDAFPIRDAEAPPEEMDEIMTQQFQLLQQCLEDDCPTIREIAVQGTLRILNSFWELIPAPVIATFVNKLTGELAYDMAWSGSRVALLGGMIQLVDNPHAQPVLKQALPHLAPLLTDPVVKVREAMAALLSAVSKTRGLHFYEVVPLEMLLAVMSSDVPPVSQAIQQILVPSYFPNPEEGSLHVVNLLKAKPLAGQAFCGHLVSCFEVQPREEADAGDASLDAAFKYTVPIEHILSLFGNLKNHMLATCTSLVDADKEVAKDKKKKRTAKTSNKKAVAGWSKRGGADKSSEQASGPADPDAAADKAIEVEGETIETWASWAAGLAQLAKGLAGAVHRGQCGGLDIAVAMGVDELELLLEACPSLAARLSILDVAATLPFLAASAALRATLYTQLATGSPLCFAKPVPSEGPDPSLLTAVVRCLCSSTGGAKLVAMVIKTLGLRPSKTVHIPVGHCKSGAATDTNEDEDDVRCGACGEAEPSHTMLLCDGCDAAYHMACLKPALHSVPCGDWFCHSCEQEVQACSMAPADLARCINALLQEPGGRGLLHSHRHFGQLLAGLQLQAQQQCQMLTRKLAHAGPQGQDHVTDLTEPAPSKGQGRRKGKAAPPAAQGSAAGQADPHMQGVSSVALLGKAALHMALTSMMAVDEAEEEEEEQLNGAGNQGGIAQAQALEASVAMLMEAEDMVEQVVEACCACDAPAPETLCSALGFAADVLGVLCDAQRLTILDMCQAGNSEQVQRLCSVGSDVACMCGKYLDDRRAVGQAAVPAQVTNAFAYTLVMCHQLVSMTSRSSSGRQGGDGSQGPAIHQLEALMDEAASEDRGVGAGLALAGLITTLLQQTLRSKSPSFVATVRPHVNTLLSSTMASSAQVPRSWMSAVAEAVGHALLCSSDVSPASQPSAPAQHLSSSHLTSSTPEGDPEAAWEQQQETDREAAAAEESEEQAVQGTDVKTLQSTSPDTWNLTNHLLQLVKQRDQQELVMDLLATSASASWRAGTVEVTVGSLALLGLLGVKGLRQKRLQLTGTEANVLYTLELLCEDIHTVTAQAQAEHTEDAVGVSEIEAVAARLLAMLEQLLG
ncbi:hypothetical protein QJQ45_016540 [Haematococcus lacustris]|nr:hypothetical protein QJQ45_016540 [Haematococcus lacustris]